MVEAFLNFLQYEKNYSGHTIASYRNDLVEWGDYLCVNEKGVGDESVTFQDVRMWMLELTEGGCKASTINRKLSALKSFYKFHNAAGTINYNPMVKIISPKKDKKVPVFFREKDLENLLHVKENCCTFEDIRDILIIEMFYQTGIRTSELRTLKRKDVDIDARVLKVLGKGNKERMIPFGDDLKDKIKEYLNVMSVEVDVSTDKLFVLASGKEMYAGKIYSIVKNNMSLVSTMKKRSPHVLRHTFATTMLNSGADINAIKNILGHESLDATQVYTHATFEKLHNIYEQAHPRALKKRR